MPRYTITATAFCTQPFDHTVDAPDERAARWQVEEFIGQNLPGDLSLDEVRIDHVERLPEPEPEPEPPPPPPVTVTADLASMAALALLIYSRDQQDKGRPFFAAELLHNAATLLRGIGEPDRAAEHIARADELVASGLNQTKAEGTTP